MPKLRRVRLAIRGRLCHLRGRPRPQPRPTLHARQPSPQVLVVETKDPSSTRRS